MTEKREIIVVGAGPCGIAVGAAAKKAGVSCALFDSGPITSSLLGYPYYMTFFSTARMLEIGDVPFTIPADKPTRRDALAYYRYVVAHWDLEVHQFETVEEVSGSEGDFTVHTRLGDSPEGRPIETRPSATGRVVGLPRVGGLHHRYVWAEAA